MFVETKWWNDFDKGYATDENKEGWRVTVGLEVPIFQGFLTRNRVEETNSRISEWVALDISKSMPDTGSLTTASCPQSSEPLKKSLRLASGCNCVCAVKDGRLKSQSTTRQRKPSCATEDQS